MVKAKITEITSGYYVNIKEEVRHGENGEELVFVRLDDQQETLPQITIQFVKDDIYAVYFLNNQFFELVKLPFPATPCLNSRAA